LFGFGLLGSWEPGPQQELLPAALVKTPAPALLAISRTIVRSPANAQQRSPVNLFNFTY